MSARAQRTRIRDQLASAVFFAGGLYVVLLGILGFAGHPRGVAPDIGPGMYWFTYVVGGCALLAGGVLVLRRGRPPKLAWWLTLVAAVPACALWLWGVVVGLVKLAANTGPSATSELAALGVLVAYALLFWLGRLRLRRRPPGSGGAPDRRPARPDDGAV